MAVMLVNGFSGLGVHTVLSVQSLFPHQYKAYLFASVAVIDSATFKGHSEIEALNAADRSRTWRSTSSSSASWVFGRSTATASGRRPSSRSSSSARRSRRRFPRSIFYLGQLVFENDRVYYKILHNETAFSIQRRLQFAGLQAIVLPIRVTEPQEEEALPLPPERLSAQSAARGRRISNAAPVG